MTYGRDSFLLWIALAITATVFAGFWLTHFGPILAGNRAPDAAVDARRHADCAPRLIAGVATPCR